MHNIAAAHRSQNRSMVDHHRTSLNAITKADGSDGGGCMIVDNVCGSSCGFKATTHLSVDAVGEKEHHRLHRLHRSSAMNTHELRQ